MEEGESKASYYSRFVEDNLNSNNDNIISQGFNNNKVEDLHADLKDNKKETVSWCTSKFPKTPAEKSLCKKMDAAAV